MNVVCCVEVARRYFEEKGGYLGELWSRDDNGPLNAM